MSSSQWPPLENNLLVTHFYEIDKQGKWVVHGERKPLHNEQEWISHGKTNLLLTALDDRIQKLSKTAIVYDTDPYKECHAHVANLRILRNHVLRKIEVYYQESASSLLTGWIWKLICTFVYAAAKAKFQTRLAQLKEIAPAELPLASLPRANRIEPVEQARIAGAGKAVEEAQNTDPLPVAASREKVLNPTTWANYQVEILTKRAAEGFLSKSDLPNILWQDTNDSTYYFSHKKVNGAFAHAKVFGFYLNIYDESICKVNYKLKNKHLNAANVQALREQIVQFIESIA